MIKKTGIITLLLFLSQWKVFTQDVESMNPRIQKPGGVRAVVQLYDLDEIRGGLQVDYFINHFLNLEISAGSYYYSAGPVFYLSGKNSPSSFAPFTGLLAGKNDDEFCLMLPAGISYLSEKGFFITMTVKEYLVFKNDWDTFAFECGLGWRF